MPTGLIMRSTGSRYLVRGSDGVLHQCVAKGNLRIKDWGSTNPVSVGDNVEFLPQESEEKLGAILELNERKNYLVRRSVNLSHHKHVIAANLDQAMLLVTVSRPRTSYGFIDRFLVTAEAYEVPVVIVLNKIDELNGQSTELMLELVDTYQEAGYTVLMTAALKGKGIKAVKNMLLGKVTLLAGHSGVGKSTLINAIDPELDLFTLEISESSEKGQHTTTNAEMYELDVEAWGSAPSGTQEVKEGKPPPTFLIDTPGIKGFGLVDLRKEDIGDQFPEMFAVKGGCRFNDCMHKEEPGCAVRKALERGDIAESRYKSYIDMLEGIDEESPYRLDQ
ncbi:MAG: ribosome small subunit-dependent GTPase A [Flavobacteriales bacterium]|nr:ribosome small subunit-dependent GTPase A [Flavobacteriales bacterium]